MSLATAAQRLIRLDARNKRLVVEAVLTLAAGSFAIGVLPFRSTAGWLASRRGGRATDPAELDDLVRRCRWAVNAWADRVPWRAVCFQRGLALHLMLRRRGIGSVLRYGVAQDGEKGLHAHVWVDVGGRTVMGGEEAPRYALLASFPAARD